MSTAEEKCLLIYRLEWAKKESTIGYSTIAKNLISNEGSSLTLRHGQGCSLWNNRYMGHYKGYQKKDR